MGILLSRFRKKKTTIEVLEDLDTKIKEIQRYGQSTERRHKKIVGTLIIWSVVLYIIAALVFYFYFFPASLRDRFFYITPLLIFPLLIVLTKRMVTWYYNRKISRNRDKLSTMQKEKKKILDDVTETETYKKAKEILLKFAPDQLRMTPLSPQPAYKSTSAESPRRPSTPQAVVAPLPGASELRRRALTVSNTSTNTTGRPANSGLAPIGFAPSITPLRQTPLQTGPRSLNASTMNARSPLPRPILPQQRSYLDRLVEYLVGDGPSNRYALICQVCDSHNGMALKEEFEYFGFRCCYCNFWNAARKQKPSAPRLDVTLSQSSSPLSPKLSEHDASSASTSSVKRKSVISNPPMSPCIETFIDSDCTSSLPIPDPKIIHDPRKRRRTIYQMRIRESNDHYQDCNSDMNFHESREIIERNFSTAESVEIPADSDIEVVEKPSDNESEKDSNEANMQREGVDVDDEITNNDEGRGALESGFAKSTRIVLPSPRRVVLREPIMNAERIAKNADEEKSSNERQDETNEESQSEKMEIDESPRK